VTGDVLWQDLNPLFSNSWRKSWGDPGFGYPSEPYITAAFFNESYGITL
jgi:hypothetical protein